MNYAVGLYFDKITTVNFSRIVNAIALNGANTYMIDNKIPPHLTISYFKSENIDHVVNILENSHSIWSAGSIFWASLGIFIPKVLFAAPILNEYLLHLNTEMNNIIGRVAEHDDEGHYLPNRWVPHTALAVRLTEAELKSSLEVATRMFTAFGGLCNKLFLVECYPYREIATWELHCT